MNQKNQKKLTVQKTMPRPKHLKKVGRRRFATVWLANANVIFDAID